jgi:hypothetical protein
MKRTSLRFPSPMKHRMRRHGGDVQSLEPDDVMDEALTEDSGAGYIESVSKQSARVRAGATSRTAL